MARFTQGVAVNQSLWMVNIMHAELNCGADAYCYAQQKFNIFQLFKHKRSVLWPNVILCCHYERSNP